MIHSFTCRVVVVFGISSFFMYKASFIYKTSFIDIGKLHILINIDLLGGIHLLFIIFLSVNNKLLDVEYVLLQISNITLQWTRRCFTSCFLSSI